VDCRAREQRHVLAALFALQLYAFLVIRIEKKATVWHSTVGFVWPTAVKVTAMEKSFTSPSLFPLFNIVNCL